MIPTHLKLTLRMRGMNLDGDLNGSIANNGQWWGDFQSQLRTLGFTIEPVTPHRIQDDVSDLSDAGHAAVFAALAALPVQSWVLVLSAMRGLSQSIGDILNDDPTPDYALTRACDAELERLTQRRPFDAERGLK